MPLQDPPPPDALGLKYFQIELPDQMAYNEVIDRVEKAGIQGNESDGGFLVQDPSRNRVVLIPKPE